MARKPGRILGVRIPFFRIFYSTTYTTLYIICIAILAITPVSMMWQAIDNSAQQYVVMIGATCVLTAVIAIFIFASRLFTNRTVMAAMGKAYIPVEQGEVGRSVRKMIANQFERSALVAWESRPRDLLGEIYQAEEHGVLPQEATGVEHNDYTVGREIPIDPAVPPWGEVRHVGWSSPAYRTDNEIPHLQFTPVIEELPNLIEARAVSLTPSDPSTTPTAGIQSVDPVSDVLRRPETMGMRDYLTQLSYLGLVNPPETGQNFLYQYENARFSGVPISEPEFKSLMKAFADLLSGMNGLHPDIVDQIRAQAVDQASVIDMEEQSPESPTAETRPVRLSPPASPESNIISPVTARTAPSQTQTPYLQQEATSKESLTSIIHQTPEDGIPESPEMHTRQSEDSSSLESLNSDSGSVLRHSASPDNG